MTMIVQAAFGGDQASEENIFRLEENGGAVPKVFASTRLLSGQEKGSDKETWIWMDADGEVRRNGRPAANG